MTETRRTQQGLAKDKLSLQTLQIEEMEKMAVSCQEMQAELTLKIKKRHKEMFLEMLHLFPIESSSGKFRIRDLWLPNSIYDGINLS